MKGFPKHLNSKADYQYVRNNFPADQWQPRFQALLDERFSWLPVGTLADGDAGVEDATHRVVEMTDESGAVIERTQEEWRENPNALVFRLGFAVAEVEDLVAVG